MNNSIRNRVISYIVWYHLWTINESYDKISSACPGTNTGSIHSALRDDVSYFLSETFSQNRCGKWTVGRYAKKKKQKKKTRNLPVTCARTIQRRKRSWVMRFRVLLIIIKKTKTNVNATRKHTRKHLERTFTVCVVSATTTTVIILYDNYLQYAHRTGPRESSV